MAVTIDGTSGINTPGVVNTAAETIATTLAVTGVTTFAAGTAALPAITTTGDTNTGIFFPAADTIAFAEGGAEVMRIDSSGNVGIGTASPSNKLTVKTADGAGIAIQNAAATEYRWAVNLDNSFSAINTGVAERMRIDSSGNVGIGTSSPSGKLAVSDGTVVGEINPFSASSGCFIGTRSNHAVLFQVNASEKARIDTSGNVLVGKTTTSDSTAGWYLSGNGTGGVGFSIATTNEAFTWNNISTAGTAQIDFRTATITKGDISWNNTSTTFNTTSDYRLKNTITPMTGALEKVALLKPCTYKWNIDGSAGEGFIAHELAEVVPQAVTGEKDAMRAQKYEISPAVPATFDEEGNELTPAVEAVMGEREAPKYQGIDTSFLVATLTAAIQEQQALITALTTRITALENNNATQ